MGDRPTRQATGDGDPAVAGQFLAAGFGIPKAAVTDGPRRLGATEMAQATPAENVDEDRRSVVRTPKAPADQNDSYDPEKGHFELGGWTPLVGNIAGTGIAFWKNWTNIEITSGKDSVPDRKLGFQSRNWSQRLAGELYQPRDKERAKPIPEPTDLSGTEPRLRALYGQYATAFLGDPANPANRGAISEAADAPGIKPQVKTLVGTTFYQSIQRMVDNPELRPHFFEDLPLDKGLPDIFQKGGEVASAGRAARIDVSPDLTKPHEVRRFDTITVSVPAPRTFKSPDWTDPNMRSLQGLPGEPNENMVNFRRLAATLAQQRGDFNVFLNQERAREFQAELSARKMSAAGEMLVFAGAEASIYGIDQMVPRDQIGSLSTTIKTAGPPLLLGLTGKQGTLLGKYGTYIGAGVFVGSYFLSREFSDGQSKLMQEAIRTNENRK